LSDRKFYSIADICNPEILLLLLPDVRLFSDHISLYKSFDEDNVFEETPQKKVTRVSIRRSMRPRDRSTPTYPASPKGCGEIFSYKPLKISWCPIVLIPHPFSRSERHFLEQYRQEILQEVQINFAGETRW